MTDRIPYESERSDFSVVLSIAQGKLPASIETLPVQDFGKQVLAKCWSLEAMSRPTMSWCSEVLAHRTTELFRAYCRAKFATIPSHYKSEGEGWHAIRDPDSVKACEFEFALHFPDILCVVWPSFRQLLKFTHLVAVLLSIHSML